MERSTLIKRLVPAFALLMIAFLAVVFISCGASRPKGKNYNKALDTDTVIMLDTRATTQLARQDEWVERKNGLLEAHVILRNTGGRTLKLEIRTYFKDSHGATLETPSDIWDPVTVNPHEDFHYFRLCPNIKAEGYQFHVRMAKEEH